MEKKFNLQSDKASELRFGDIVYLSGTVFTARDAAHKRLFAALTDEKKPPFDLTNAAIYYAGPSDARPGAVIGSIGPTTSGRVDVYTPLLLDSGVKYMIGKGKRSKAVIEAIIRNGAVYFSAVGGAGALYANCVQSAEIVAYPDLGTEAVRRLNIVDFPVIVAIDSRGDSIFK